MFRKIAVIFLLCLGIPLMAAGALAAGPGDARQFVDNLGKEVLDIVNAGGNKEQRQQQLQRMFTQNVDIAWMGQFVLGRAWQQASQEQCDRYLQAYRQYLLSRYTTNFADYTGAKYTITGVKSDEAGQVTVNMQIKAPKQSEETLAGYRLRSENGQFKIIDIIVEGVSLITTQRSEFASVAQQKGMDGLIAAIDAKITAQ